MTIRHQPQSDKHQYASPTTPGLYVAFRDYAIELVCLNTNPKIGPRFWSDQSYWSPKYKREIRGISNLGKELDLTDVLTQTAVIQIVKEYRIKALVATKTKDKIVRLVRRRISYLREQRETLAKKQLQAPIDAKKNATFVDTGKRSTLAKVRESENG